MNLIIRKASNNDINTIVTCFILHEPVCGGEAIEMRNEIVKKFHSFSENPESINMQKVLKKNLLGLTVLGSLKNKRFILNMKILFFLNL